MNINKLLKFSSDAGKLMLQSGGETYRVEETVSRICQSFDVDEVEVFASPTAVMISISFNGEIHTTRTLEKYARNNGYDGIIVKNVLDIGPYGRLEAHKFSTVVAAMNPNQIKSATDNTGTYSKENDDIRLRKIEEDNTLFLENGYSENWIKNATEEEKEVAKYCIGI